MTLPDPNAQGPDFSSLSEDELSEKLTEVNSRVTEIRESAAESGLSDEMIEEVEQLSEQKRAIEAEVTSRNAVAAERSDRFEAALAAFEEPTAETDEPTEGEEGSEEPEGQPEEEPAQEPAQPQAQAPMPAAASNRAGSMADLNRSRPAHARPRESEPRRASMVATALADGFREGADLPNRYSIADAITRKRNGFGNIPAGTREYVSIATGSKDISTRVGGDLPENMRVFRQLADEHRGLVASGALHQERSALVASGACCTPLEPIYDFASPGDIQTPIEDALAVTEAGRGGVRFVRSTCGPTAGAVGVFDCGDDDDPANPVVKPCLHVDCPDVGEELVTAVSQCVEFGNLHYRTFPEQVENFLERVALEFASAKERFYLGRIDAGATAVTATVGTYGASRTLRDVIVRAAAAFRRRNNMSRRAPLQIMLEEALLDVLRVDAMLDGSGGAEFITDQDVVTWLRADNLDPVFYVHGLTPGDLDGPQIAGELNAWPDDVTFYLFKPGAMVRLDGGTLDVGVVRDSALNRTNNLQIFMEEWIGLVDLGCETIKVTTDICVNGAYPAGVTPAACNAVV